MSASQLSSRSAKEQDFESILQLLHSVNLTTEGVRRDLENFFVVRDAGGNLIGVAGLEYYGASALLRSVAVSSQHRGEGIGHALVQQCIAESKKRNVHDLYLLTETAEKFMKRFGFRPIAKESVDSKLHASEEIGRAHV